MKKNMKEKLKNVIRSKTVQAIGVVFALGAICLLVLAVGGMVTIRTMAYMFAGCFCFFLLIIFVEVIRSAGDNRRMEALEKEVADARKNGGKPEEVRKPSEATTGETKEVKAD